MMRCDRIGSESDRKFGSELTLTPYEHDVVPVTKLTTQEKQDLVQFLRAL